MIFIHLFLLIYLLIYLNSLILKHYNFIYIFPNQNLADLHPSKIIQVSFKINIFHFLNLFQTNKK